MTCTLLSKDKDWVDNVTQLPLAAVSSMSPSDAMKVNHRTRRPAEDTKSYKELGR